VDVDAALLAPRRSNADTRLLGDPQGGYDCLRKKLATEIGFGVAACRLAGAALWWAGKER
jgi:hypothetical protein